MQVKEALIKILADGAFYSGEALGEMLGMSRSAVWKYIQALAQYQLDIYGVSGKGYRLAKPLELLDREAILKNVGALPSGQLLDIEVLFEVDSTNRYLIEKNKFYPQGHAVCLSEYQHAGRGRRGRQWVSPFGSNLYCSILWRSKLSLTALSCLGLIVGVTVARALTSLGLIDHQLKWPNDLFWKDRKLGGILIEAAGEVTGPGVIVIGIGLNVDMPRVHTHSIDQPWVDLSTALGRTISRNAVAAAVIKQVFNGLGQFEEQGFESFYQEWSALDLLKGKSVEVIIGNDAVVGYAEGVDSQGALLIRRENGTLNRYFSGEVSVRYSV